MDISFMVVLLLDIVALIRLNNCTQSKDAKGDVGNEFKWYEAGFRC
jgi:hypothetical protein